MAGSRWRIEDGSKVKIWEDNWMSESACFKVFTAVRGLDKDAMVKELIDRNFARGRRTF